MYTRYNAGTMMMRAGVLLVVGAIACGGGGQTPPPARPEPIAQPPATNEGSAESRQPAPDPVVAAPPAPAPPAPAPPAPAPPAPAPVVPLRDRLHDGDGPVAGMPGWNLKRVADQNVCGGTRVVVSRGRRKLDPDQTALAKLYEVRFPADLDFDPAVKVKQQASLKRFNAYVEEMKKVSTAASERYAKVLTDASAEPPVRAAAAARIAQVSLRFAAALARAPIPADVRGGEFAKDKVEAFCGNLEEIAEPLATRGQEAITRACAQAIEGWWAPLCAAAP